MISIRPAYLVLAGALLAGAYALAEWLNETTPVSAAMPSRRELLSQRWRHRNILLVYGAGRPESARRYRDWAERQQRRMRWRTLTVQSDRETTRPDLQDEPVYLVGTTASNRILTDLAPSLPVRFTRGGFSLGAKAYRDPSDILMMRYPNPVNPKLPLHIVVGNQDAYLLDFLEKKSITGLRGDYQVFRGGACILFGLFTRDKAGRWVIDKAEYRDYAAGERLAVETPHYRFFLDNLDMDPEALNAFVARRETLYRDIAAFAGAQRIPGPIDYHLYPTIEDKGLVTNNTLPAHNDAARNAVYETYRRDIPGDDGQCVAQFLLRRSVGKPAVAALETGLSLYFTGTWQGKGYAYWASRLYLSGNRISLAELLDNGRIQAASPLVTAPMAGTFVAYLIEEAWGRTLFLERFASWRPAAAETETADLDAGWDAYLRRLSAKYKDRIAWDRAHFPRADAFQKGFCYAHEGYQIYNGYMSRQSDASLSKLAGMGVNAVSLTPFTSIRNPKKAAPFRIQHGSGGENDESLIHAAMAAKQRGMTVMLKPHIWAPRSWPGEIEMSSPAEWDRFFTYYYRWIRHYALLAEMHGIPILCVGVELSRTTVGHEDRWIEMVRKLRKLYSGRIVYAANWGREFEEVTFWNAFDYIGINCYYPLSDSEEATDRELERGAQRVADLVERVAERYHKPVLFTEIGFKSTPAPWIAPHEYRGDGPVNLTHQARAYEAVLSALYGRSWWRGIYWWKWPSYLEDGGPENNDFTPNGKPAQDVAAAWYRERL